MTPTTESFQDTLFEDPIGLRFRHAREKSRLTQELVAQQLKLPVAVLDAIEREDWARLGAPIFVRSYVGSYAKLLGLPATLADEVVRGKPAPQLLAIGGSIPVRRGLHRGVVRMLYLAATVALIACAIMLAVYLQGPRSAAQVSPLDDVALFAGAADLPAPVATHGGSSARAGAIGAAEKPAEQPLPAAETVHPAAMPTSSTPPAPVTLAATPAQGTIKLHFRRDSWVDIVDRAGAHLERGVVPAGTERQFATVQLRGVTLGDAAAVDLSVDGDAVDLAPYSDAKVARFTVSSEGRIASANTD